jgi:hypothetical protein
MVISTSELSFYKYERAIVSAMVKMFKRKQADPTFYSQRLFGAYAASNPTIPKPSLSIHFGVPSSLFLFLVIGRIREKCVREWLWCPKKGEK